MIENFEGKLKEYASLIVNKGVNIQKGQPMVVRSLVECASFARALVEAGYKAGAGEVTVEWSDEFVLRQKYLNADDKVFDTFPAWRKVQCEGSMEARAALISIAAEDPENLKGVNPDRIMRISKISGEALKNYREKMMANYTPWCVVSVPTVKWAEKMFPKLKGSEAIDALWNAIFKAARITGDGKVVKVWEDHIKLLCARAEKLTNFNFKTLHYTNSIGTDLTIELADGHKWVACGEKAQTGIEFIANIPTEEIFTLPKKHGVNGKAVASKPLVIRGSLIEGFSFTFKDGKIVDITAKSGLKELQNEVNLDEGASYLGEVALVPFASPISEMNILFYNTLFDENASCHLAFGAAYPCFKDENLTKEQMAKNGMNDSMTHEDFMIGTPDLTIVGVTHDGKTVQVFKDGNFSI